mgnify:CR=1 FL=1
MSHHPWTCLKAVWMWCSETWFSGVLLVRVVWLSHGWTRSLRSFPIWVILWFYVPFNTTGTCWVTFHCCSGLELMFAFLSISLSQEQHYRTCSQGTRNWTFSYTYTWHFSSVPKEMQKGAYVHSHLFSFLRKRCHRLGKSKYPEAFQCSCMTHHAATTTIYVWGLITFVLTAWRYKTWSWK